ncbi:hypothetical protein P3T76_005114 [Phytophthora citrophthora]|uniref:RxLR effector PexRD54 WY domain-containing protein n=1 Tax=Phytophthora citrophthora TaxID=4793 RepID=A0AAD9LNB7_9STRA|nr:hypothetical protein P3T76_005114 [Phytophthora citrophthora]
MAFKSSLFTKVLVLVALLACISVTTAVSTSKTVNAQPLDLNDAAATQFLRSDERKLAVPVAGLEKVATSNKSWFSRVASKIKSLFRGKKSPTDMFVKMGLANEGALVFYGSKFTKWTDYVRKNAKGDADLAIFSTLATHYSDDALAKMLHSAKKMESTKELATKLEVMQTTNWAFQKSSPTVVLKTLELDQAGEKLFKNPQFSRWAKYVTETSKNPEKAMFNALAKSYDEVALTKIIASAAKTDDVATGLRTTMFQTWKNLGRTPDDMNAVMKLSATSDDVTKGVLQDYSKFFGKVKVD